MSLSGCAPETPPTAFDACPSAAVGDGTCYYSGYGTPCPVPCNFAPSCTYSVHVTWSGGGYCCPGYEGPFVDCRCEDGQSVCGTLYRSIPTSTCEFCNWDFGVPSTDLGADALD